MPLDSHRYRPRQHQRALRLQRSFGRQRPSAGHERVTPAGQPGCPHDPAPSLAAARLPGATRPAEGLRVALAGGSLGGLTAAVLLAELGCDVRVFERSASELLGRGVGIVVHPITVRFLVERRGLDLAAISTGTAEWVYVAADGSVVHAEPCAYRFTAWNTLYRALRACLPADRYMLAHPLADLGPHECGVRARFGSRLVDTDLLVGADGSQSTTRSLLLPGVEPNYSGYVGWRGTLPEAELGERTRAALADAITYHLTGDSHILAYPIPSMDGSVAIGDRLMNFVWYRDIAPGPCLDALMTDREGVRRDLSVPPGMVAEEAVAELHAAARRLPPALAELVTRVQDPFVQRVVDVTAPRMAFGRVCLIGDAAFTARPHAAAGTAKAAADAWALAGALAGAGGDVELALRAWEPGQLELGRSLVDRSRRIGERYQRAGAADPSDRRLRFGLREPGDSQVAIGGGLRPESASKTRNLAR
jgi:2,6-dihydroxypyridine 3-monooxygenase